MRDKGETKAETGETKKYIFDVRVLGKETPGSYCDRCDKLKDFHEVLQELRF